MRHLNKKNLSDRRLYVNRILLVALFVSRINLRSSVFVKYINSFLHFFSISYSIMLGYLWFAKFAILVNAFEWRYLRLQLSFQLVEVFHFSFVFILCNIEFWVRSMLPMLGNSYNFSYSVVYLNKNRRVFFYLKLNWKGIALRTQLYSFNHIEKQQNNQIIVSKCFAMNNQSLFFCFMNISSVCCRSTHRLLCTFHTQKKHTQIVPHNATLTFFTVKIKTRRSIRRQGESNDSFRLLYKQKRNKKN